MNCDADSGVSVPGGRGRGRGRGGGIAVLPEVSRGLSLRYNRGIRSMKEKEKEEEKRKWKRRMGRRDITKKLVLYWK